MEISTGELSLEPLAVISMPKAKKPEAIVVSCFCCQSLVDGNSRTLSHFNLKKNGFTQVKVLGIADTLLSRGARAHLPALSMKTKKAIRDHNVKRVVMIVHECCDFDSKVSFHQSLEDRVLDIYRSSKVMRGWFPVGTGEDVDIEIYMVQKQSNDLLSISRLKNHKPNVIDYAKAA